MSELSRTPEPPYYAVIFTSRRASEHEGYGEMADRMVKLAGAIVRPGRGLSGRHFPTSQDPTGAP